MGIRILNGSSILRSHERKRLVEGVTNVFGLPVGIAPSPLDIQRAFDGSRRQFNSTVLLAQMVAEDRSQTEKNVCIVDVDLFVPILTFVFGEAQLGGNAAIVSTQRLSNQFYGLEEDRIRLIERLVKEVVHELGHTFGLRHCRQFECVMRSSTYVEEIDLKQTEMCSDCRVTLNKQTTAFRSRAETI